MDTSLIARLAEQLAAGQISLDHFLHELARPKTADLGDVQLDLDRSRRCGFPEVVFGQGKSVETIERVFGRLLADGFGALATRIGVEQASQLSDRFPTAHYNAVAGTFAVAATKKNPAEENNCGRVVVITAGTTDLAVAEEAAETARWMGAAVQVIVDVGVAGPHRLLAHLDEIQQADAAVVVAGMEGALPSMVGGYVACPVIAVPTSVGYGASLGGFAALLGMLNSCAANVAVVNIDAGFKGGYLAAMIAKRVSSCRTKPI
ncbi:MAG TPA: nickel pincer cofactor biosynthesis protein LarB [Pirellulales bacterium]|jgi:NCAIR mutase (PurE)-related protein|nr:nickel pincer cofactor biosynthesis protein LarB [Pirellulales bacterium]